MWQPRADCRTSGICIYLSNVCYLVRQPRADLCRQWAKTDWRVRRQVAVRQFPLIYAEDKLKQIGSLAKCALFFNFFNNAAMALIFISLAIADCDEHNFTAIAFKRLRILSVLYLLYGCVGGFVIF